MLFVEIAIILVLIVVNGVLSMSELAIVSARPARLKAMAEQEVKGSRRALALASDPGRFLSTVQIGITLVGVVSGAFSGATLGTRLAAWLAAQGVPESVAQPLAYGLVVTLITYLSLVAGELVPKQLALRHAEAIAVRASPAMTLLARIAAPLVSLLDFSGELLLALLGHRGVPSSKVTEDEIRTLVAEAESAGIIEPEERAMIARVMRLADRAVSAVMTPRHEAAFIDLTDPPDVIKRRITQSPHSRLLACDGSLDNVVGIVQAKELLDALLQNGGVDPREHVVNAPVVPETMDALDVVGVLRASTVHLGLVYDEYGNFEGVVTPADILEAIVGEFRSEEDTEEPYVVRRKDGSYLVSGTMPADDLADLLGLRLPEDRDYHTAAGFAVTEFGRLPQVGDIIDAYGCRFEVVDMDGRRVDKLLVSRPAQPRRAGR